MEQVDKKGSYLIIALLYKRWQDPPRVSLTTCAYPSTIQLFSCGTYDMCCYFY